LVGLPGLLIALVVLSDLLIWQTAQPRLALVVFLLVLGLAATAMVRAGPAARRVWLWFPLALAPLVEEVTPLALLLAGLGLLALLAGLVTGETALIPRIAGCLPVAGLALVWRDARSAGRAMARVTSGRADAARIGRDWALPLGLGSVSVLLFSLANPLLDRWLANLFSFRLQRWPSADRILFWAMAALIVWPCLRLVALPPLSAAHPTRQRAMTSGGILNERSVLRALVLFNLIFALQTGMDVAYLWGGISLPAGTSHAAYAHRGAYPLLVSALLAGGFALLTQPWLAGRPALRWLLLAWVAQTVALVASSLLRLDLYVDTFGLTRLRLAAAIWMGTVALGLALMLAQIALQRSAEWLAARAALLGLAVLYASAFLNGDGLIARHNLAMPDAPWDAAHLCALGPGGVPALRAFELQTRRAICPHGGPWVDAPQDWRDWGWRNWRLRQQLSPVATGLMRADAPQVQPMGAGN